MRPLTTTATATAAAALLLALTGCGGGDGPSPSAAPSAEQPSALPDSCRTADPANPPAECLTPGEASPTGPPPADGSAHYAALKIDPLPGELRATGNDQDVNKTSDSFTVTVRAGYRFGIQAVCEGRTELNVTTVPDSDPAVKFSCGFNGTPSQLGVEAPTPVTKDTSYQVRISVPAPARWYATFYETNAPSNAE